MVMLLVPGMQMRLVRYPVVKPMAGREQAILL